MSAPHPTKGDLMDFTSPGVCSCGEQLPPASGPSHTCKVMWPTYGVAPGASGAGAFPPSWFQVNSQPTPTVRGTLLTMSSSKGTLLTPEHLCPDLLRYEQIGAADRPRGRLVRVFFWLLRAWPP
jgi:hypothetical protein